jgi:RimJ/RimL family protein N-acetyltransferase
MRTTRRAITRDLLRADVDDMAKWTKYKEPEFQWANYSPHSEWEKDSWYAAGKAPGNRRFAILDEQGHLIGVVSLRNIDTRLGQATLGIRMSPDAVNHGYGTQAISALVDYAFTAMGLEQVNLDVAENNMRARRCYQKCGFTLIGSHVSHDGTRLLDMVITKWELNQKRQQPQRPAAEGNRR